MDSRREFSESRSMYVLIDKVDRSDEGKEEKIGKKKDKRTDQIKPLPNRADFKDHGMKMLLVADEGSDFGVA